MKIFELAKELNTTPKDLISFFKAHGYSVSSHMQKVTDEMIDLAHEKFQAPSAANNVAAIEPAQKKENNVVDKSSKIFRPDDEIPCKSVTPWKLTIVGSDKTTVYHWEYFGDVEYLKYRDLQALRRTEYITKPSILIMDRDLRSQWGRELGDTYKYFENIEYPEEYFDRSDDDFKDLLLKAPDWLKEIIKVTAMAMVRAKNYPSLSKIILIDEILGTCIKEFL